MVVVNKDDGMTSEALAASLGLKLVHRIDRGTSGLVVLARDARTVQRMQRALRAGLVERIYLFVANGVVRDGTRESFIARDRGDGLRGTPMNQSSTTSAAPKQRAQRCVAHIFDTHVDAGVTRGRARLETGRTHQLRIQLAEGGTSVVGERVYVRDASRDGVPLAASGRLMLHAERLRFVHPNNKREIDVVIAPAEAPGSPPWGRWGESPSGHPPMRQLSRPSDRRDPAASCGTVDE